jgi:hypothetical protein
MLQADAQASQPHDTCFRCGKPTPVGVSLCEADNPGRIKAPSATQVHGTIAVGVLAGFVLLVVLLSLLSRPVGEFSAAVVGSAARADGSIEIVVNVTNDGDVAAAAHCRVEIAGVPAVSGLDFFSQAIEPGETRAVTRTLSLPAGAVAPRQPRAYAVRCD